MIPFKAACTSLTVAFQLFKPNGTPIRADVKLALTQAEPATSASANSANKQHEPDDALGRRARRARRPRRRHAAVDRPPRPTATRTAGALIAEANGDRQPAAPAARHAAQPPAARLMPAARARRLRVGQGQRRSRSTPRGHGPRREDRGAQLPRAARHGDDPHGRPRGRARRRRRRSSSATRSRSALGDLDARQPRAGLHRRDRHLRARVHQRRGDDLACARTTSRTACTATGAAPTFQDMTRRRRRARRSSARTGCTAGDDRDAPDRAQVPAAEHGVRPRLHHPAGGDARTASSASPTGKVFLQKQRNGSRPGARRSPGARTSSRSSRA